MVDVPRPDTSWRVGSADGAPSALGCEHGVEQLGRESVATEMLPPRSGSRFLLLAGKFEVVPVVDPSAVLTPTLQTVAITAIPMEVRGRLDLPAVDTRLHVSRL